MQYEIKPYDINEIGRNGHGSIRVSVVGYWSGESITAYIDRGYSDEKSWKFKIGHSSGGRDTKEVASDIEASRNFGAAMIALADVLDSLQNSQTMALLEESYQAQRATDRAEHAAERAAKQAEFEADTPLGEEAAKRLVHQLVEKGQPISIFRRGEDRPYHASVIIREKTKLYYAGSPIARKALISLIAMSSKRTAIL